MENKSEYTEMQYRGVFQDNPKVPPIKLSWERSPGEATNPISRFEGRDIWMEKRTVTYGPVERAEVPW